MKTYWTFFIAILACFLLNSCTVGDSKPVREDLAVQLPATQVKVVEAKVQTFEQSLIASGLVGSAAEVRTQCKRSGTIAEIFVKNGQAVRKGQLLAVLNKDAQELALRKAKLLVQEKKVEFDDQMMSYRLLKDTLQFNQVRNNIYLSSGLANAEVLLLEAEFDYENSNIFAQIDGLVSGLEITYGSPVALGDLICFLHNPTDMIVNADVLESDALMLKSGTLADITLTANADQVVKAKVEVINPRVDLKTGLVRVTLKLINPPKIFPGMHVQVVIKLPHGDNIVVPKAAVVMRSGKAVVFTCTDSLAKWNYVTLGKDNGVEVEILAGVEPRSKVIISNNLQLAHDAPVQVVK